jgi:hypothetical protein
VTAKLTAVRRLWKVSSETMIRSAPWVSSRRVMTASMSSRRAACMRAAT